MPARLTPRRIADDVFEITTASPGAAQALSRQLRTEGLAEDVVPGLASVAVRFDPAIAVEIEAWLMEQAEPDEIDADPGAIIEIGVAYGGDHGPDFESVCQQLGLSGDGLIAMHTERIHKVEMMGFTPGFSYISGLPDGLNIPRLQDPRPRVAAGSVGLSARFTGLYALTGPGGWPLIGHTPEPLFSPERADPFLLEPGVRIRFRAL